MFGFTLSVCVENASFFPKSVTIDKCHIEVKDTHSQNVKILKELQKRNVKCTLKYSDWFSIEDECTKLQTKLGKTLTENAEKTLKEMYADIQSVYDKGVNFNEISIVKRILESSNKKDIVVNIREYIKFIHKNKNKQIAGEHVIDYLECCWSRDGGLENCKIDKTLLMMARGELKKYYYGTM